MSDIIASQHVRLLVLWEIRLASTVNNQDTIAREGSGHGRCLVVMHVTDR